MDLRTSLAVLTARVLSLAGKIAGRQGVTLGGKAALKIDPTILKKLSAQVKGDIIVTCGTNGKTTTNNLIASAYEAEGKKVICNRTGSNMLTGVTDAFLLAAKLDGTIDADAAVIEIDEASTLRVFPFLKPDYMVLTNLFRDQLDRYGEIDITMNLLKKAMDMAPDMKIIVNADDALSAYLAMESGHSYVTYGISEPHPDSSSGHEIREGRFCKRCGEKLVYDFYHFSQLGVYHCPKCGFKRPFVDFDASGIDLRDGLKFSISSAGGEKKKIRSHYRGFYNAYNILACWSLLKSAGLSAEHFDQMLDSYHPDNGRNESFRIGGSSVLLNLAKNPAGFNQNISAVMEDREEKDLIIVINDNAQDGKDVSWLWDVDFDRLDDPSVRSVTVSGIRCQDMRLRLKYVSIQAVLTEDVRTAVEDRLRDGCGNIYLLVNYTALYSSRRILKEMSERSSAKTAARA